MAIFNIVPALGEVKLPSPEPLTLLAGDSFGDFKGFGSGRGSTGKEKETEFPYLPSQAMAATQVKQAAEDQKRIAIYDLMQKIQSSGATAFDFFSSPEGLNYINSIQRNYTRTLEYLDVYDEVMKINRDLYKSTMERVKSGELSDVSVEYDFYGNPLRSFGTWKKYATEGLAFGETLTPFQVPNYKGFQDLITKSFGDIPASTYEKTLNSWAKAGAPLSSIATYDQLRTYTKHTRVGNEPRVNDAITLFWQGLGEDTSLQQVYNIRKKQSEEYYNQKVAGKMKNGDGKIYENSPVDYEDWFSSNFENVLKGKYELPSDSWTSNDISFQKITEEDRERVDLESFLASLKPRTTAIPTAYQKTIKTTVPRKTNSVEDKEITDVFQMVGLGERRAWNGNSMQVQDINRAIAIDRQNTKTGWQLTSSVWFGYNNEFYDARDVEPNRIKALVGNPSVTIQSLTGEFAEFHDPNKYLQQGFALVERYKDLKQDPELKDDETMAALYERLIDFSNEKETKDENARNFFDDIDYTYIDYIIKKNKEFDPKSTVGPNDFKTLAAQVRVEASPDDRWWPTKGNSASDKFLDRVYVQRSDADKDDDMYEKGLAYEFRNKIKIREPGSNAIVAEAYDDPITGEKKVLYNNVWVPVDDLNIGAFGSFPKYKEFVKKLQLDMAYESQIWALNLYNAIELGAE